MEFDRFKAKFVDQLIDEDESKIDQNTKFRELSSWDSLTAMAVIVMVEDEYKVKIPDDAFRNFGTINDIFLYVKERAE